MSLTEPVTAAVQEIDFVDFVREVFFFNFAPSGFSLFRGRFRILVNEMLELVDRNPVRDKDQRIRQMAVIVFLGVFFEEEFHPRPGEKLHAHGMDFGSFHGRPHVIRDTDVPAGKTWNACPAS